MNGIGWITVAEAARLCGTDELRITLWMNGNHIAYARFDGILMIDGASLFLWITQANFDNFSKKKHPS